MAAADVSAIKGYHAHIAPEAFGRNVSAFINLTTDPQNYKSVKALAKEMYQVASCHHISGNASFILHVMVEDLPALELVVERLSEFGQTQTSIVLSTTACWETSVAATRCAPTASITNKNVKSRQIVMHTP